MVFILTGVYLLVTLFVGVIIKSMELLQKSVAEETEILTKVYRQQTEFGYGPLALATLLEVFDMLDQSANGVLTVRAVYLISGYFKFLTGIIINS